MLREESNKLIALAIPTNEPEVAMKYLLSDDSLKNLQPFSKYVTFLFNFQKPWTSELIKKAEDKLDEYGFSYLTTFSQYIIERKGEVPFNQIRYDACKLLPDAKFFVLADDDFSFTDGASDDYFMSLIYLLENPSCGMILMKGRIFLPELAKGEVGPVDIFSFRCITDKGIILRNLDGGLALPDEALALVGSDEEKIACSWRMNQGFYPAFINRCRTRHYENNNQGDVVSGEDMYNWNEFNIIENNVNKFIKDNFYRDFINGGWRRVQLVDIDHFQEVTDMDKDKSYITSYVGVDLESRLVELLEE